MESLRGHFWIIIKALPCFDSSVQTLWNPSYLHSTMHCSLGWAFHCLRKMLLRNCVIQMWECCSSLASPPKLGESEGEKWENSPVFGTTPNCGRLGEGCSLGYELERSLVFPTSRLKGDSGKSSRSEAEGLRTRPENFLEVWRTWIVMADGTRTCFHLWGLRDAGSFQNVQILGAGEDGWCVGEGRKDG